MSLWHRTTDHLEDTCLRAPIHFASRSTGIGADIVMDNILYAVLDIRPDDICYRSRADGIAVGNLSMGESCAMN